MYDLVIIGAGPAGIALAEISSNFVDRALRIRSHTIHEITLSYTKEQDITALCKASDPHRACPEEMLSVPVGKLSFLYMTIRASLRTL